MLNVNIFSNHLNQVIKHLPITVNKRSSKNTTSEENFNESKSEYKTALKNSRYHNKELIIQKEQQSTQKQKQSLNIIWFNPPFSENSITNVAKEFLNL